MLLENRLSVTFGDAVHTCMFTLQTNTVTEHNTGKTQWICLPCVTQMVVFG